MSGSSSGSGKKKASKQRAVDKDAKEFLKELKKGALKELQGFKRQTLTRGKSTLLSGEARGETQCLRTLGLISRTMCAVSKTRAWVANRDGAIRVTSPSGKIVSSMKPWKKELYVWALHCVGDYVWVGYVNGQIDLRHKDTTERVMTLQDGHCGQIFDFVSEANSVWSASGDWTIRHWNATTGELNKMFSGHQNNVRCVTVAGDHLWSGSDDCSIRVWGKESGETVHEIKLKKSALCMCTSLGGQVWVGCEDARVRVYDANTFKLIHSLDAHTGRVSCILSAGPQVWCGSVDKTISVWEASSAERIALSQILVGHTSYIHTLAQLGWKVWSASNDKTIKLWLAESVVDTMDAELHELQESGGPLRGRVDALTEENAALKQRVAELEKNVAEQDNMLKALRDCNQARGALEAEIEVLREAKGALEECTEARAALQAQLDALRAANAELQARVAELEAQLAAAQAAGGDASAKAAEREKELAALRDELAQAKARGDALESERDEARKACGEAEGARDALQSELDALRAANADLQARVADLEAQLAAAQAAGGDASAVAAQREADLAALRDELAQVKAKRDALEGERDEASRGLTDCSEARAGLEEELAAVKAKRDALEGERDEASRGLADCTEARSGLQDELEALRARLAEAEGARAALQDELNASRGETEQLRGQLNDASAKAQAAQLRRERTKADLKRAGAQLTAQERAEVAALSRYINLVLRDDTDVAQYVPINPDSFELFPAVSNGVILNKLVNVAKPGTVDARVLAMGDNLTDADVRGNLSLFLHAESSIGGDVRGLNLDAMCDGQPHALLDALWEVVMSALNAKLNTEATPALCFVMGGDDEESQRRARGAQPDELLRAWLNHHLSAEGHPGTVAKYGADLSSGEAYGALQHATAAALCKSDVSSGADPVQRAGMVLDNAQAMGADVWMDAADLASTNDRLHRAFSACLFNARNGLPPAPPPKASAELSEEEAREQAAFLAWINQLGLSVFVTDLGEDLRDGLVLLHIIDKVAGGGYVPWGKANKKPKHIMQRVENCNLAFDLSKKLLDSKLVGIGGKDIADGNRKLTLGLVWQLLRYDMFSFLRKASKGAVQEEEIIRWANEQVEGMGAAERMGSFKDKSLGSCVFFLRLLNAVSPGAVEDRLIAAGDTPDACEANAKLAICVAWKLGVEAFVLWEDLVAVKSRLVFTFVAGVMLWVQKQASGLASVSTSVDASSVLNQ